MRKKLIGLFVFSCVSAALMIPALGLGQQRDTTQKGAKGEKKAKGGQGDVLPIPGLQAGVAGQAAKGKGGGDPDAPIIQRFQGVDKNGDGFISNDEMSAQAKETGVWKKFDVDGDTRLNLEEYKVFYREKAVAEQVLKLSGGAKGTANLYSAMVESASSTRPVIYAVTAPLR